MVKIAIFILNLFHIPLNFKKFKFKNQSIHKIKLELVKSHTGKSCIVQYCKQLSTNNQKKVISTESCLKYDTINNYSTVNLIELALLCKNGFCLLTKSREVLRD